MLQETAHPQGLYLIDECEEISLQTIYQKANVRTLGPEEDEPTTSPITDNDFFTRYDIRRGVIHSADLILFSLRRLLWNEARISFTERTEQEEKTMKLVWCQNGKPCAACAVHRRDRSQDEWTEDDETISHSGVDYHLWDFVYVRPEVRNNSDRLYIIGQILSIQLSDGEDDIEYLSVNIQVYQRNDTLIRARHRGTLGPYASNEVRFSPKPCFEA